MILNKIVMIYSIVSIISVISQYMYTEINIDEYEIDQIAYIDIDKDGQEDKVQIVVSNDTVSDKKRKKTIIIPGNDGNQELEFNLKINDNSYKLEIDKSRYGEVINKFAIADINFDNCPEILVRYSNNAISPPPPSTWKIYKYNNNNLTFVKKIFDGKILYNHLTKKIDITYSDGIQYQDHTQITNKASFDIDF